MKEPHEPATPTPDTCELIPELPFPWNGAYIQWEREMNGLRHDSKILCTEKNREPMEIELEDWEDEP